MQTDSETLHCGGRIWTKELLHCIGKTNPTLQKDLVKLWEPYTNLIKD